LPPHFHRYRLPSRNTFASCRACPSARGKRRCPAPTYVIDGTIELKVAGRAVERLGPGDADTVLPETPLLVTNVGSTVARVLVMLATPDGKPVQSSASAP